MSGGGNKRCSGKGKSTDQQRRSAENSKRIPGKNTEGNGNGSDNHHFF